MILITVNEIMAYQDEEHVNIFEMFHVHLTYGQRLLNLA